MKPGTQFRDLRMLVLAMHGWTCRMIADRMGVTCGRVSIIVRTEGAKRGIVMRRNKQIVREEKPVAPKPIEGIIVPPRQPREFRPITLPTALRVNGARANAVQKPVWSMASNPSQEWVD